MSTLNKQDQLYHDLAGRVAHLNVTCRQDLEPLENEFIEFCAPYEKQFNEAVKNFRKAYEDKLAPERKALDDFENRHNNADINSALKMLRSWRSIR